MEEPTWMLLQKQLSTEMLMNRTSLAVKGLENEMMEINIVLTKMRETHAY